MGDQPLSKAKQQASQDTLYLRRLLGCRTIPGTHEEISRFRIRIDELTRFNGQGWVRANAGQLLAQWALALTLGKQDRQG